jgi:hypothetical protein
LYTISVMENSYRVVFVVWYSYILGSCRVHCRNISDIAEGSTWASQFYAFPI